MYTPLRALCALLLTGGLLLGGCQALREVAQLRQVDFELGGVRDAVLAGVDLSAIRSYRDLTPGAVIRLGSAIGEGRLPFRFVVNVQAENPEANGLTARLVELDWTLLLEDRETVSGTLDQNIVLPPGQVVTIPVDVELDLVEFFGDNLQDLVELALAVSGRGGEAKQVALRAVPTVQTPVGPIRYPRPITIVDREVGTSAR